MINDKADDDDDDEDKDDDEREKNAVSLFKVDSFLNG